MTPAQRHRARMHARTGAASTAVPGGARTRAAATEYELQKARLGVDLRRLKEIQSLESKIALKRELLPDYADWVAGALESDTGTDDVILTHIMIWRIDTGDYAGALPLAEYVLRHQLPLPERFDRTPATLIVEEIADAALKLFGQGETADLSAFLDGEVLEEVDRLATDQDMPDQVRAKLEKAQGLAALRAAEIIEPDADGPAGSKRGRFEIAQRRLLRALELDPGSGVKKRLETIGREIRKLADPDGDTP